MSAVLAYDQSLDPAFSLLPARRSLPRGELYRLPFTAEQIRADPGYRRVDLPDDPVLHATSDWDLHGARASRSSVAAAPGANVHGEAADRDPLTVNWYHRRCSCSSDRCVHGRQWHRREGHRLSTNSTRRRHSSVGLQESHRSEEANRFRRSARPTSTPWRRAGATVTDSWTCCGRGRRQQGSGQTRRNQRPISPTRNGRPAGARGRRPVSTTCLTRDDDRARRLCLGLCAARRCARMRAIIPNIPVTQATSGGWPKAKPR